MQCGPKLPPQRRPRSVTSVPADYLTRPNLSINTQIPRSHFDDEYLGSASEASEIHFGKSLPVSPYLSPYQGRLDAAVTPLGTPLGSPVIISLDQFEGFDGGLQGYFLYIH
jgi:hypothetical protein